MHFLQWRVRVVVKPKVKADRIEYIGILLRLASKELLKVQRRKHGEYIKAYAVLWTGRDQVIS